MYSSLSVKEKAAVSPTSWPMNNMGMPLERSVRVPERFGKLVALAEWRARGDAQVERILTADHVVRFAEAGCLEERASPILRVVHLGF